MTPHQTPPSVPTDEMVERVAKDVAAFLHAGEFQSPDQNWAQMSKHQKAQARALVRTVTAALAAMPGGVEWQLCEQLRAGEGNSVELFCDNPDFNGQPNCAVEVVGEWTEWEQRRFTGDTMLEALRAAHTAMLAAAPTPPTAQEG